MEQSGSKQDARISQEHDKAVRLFSYLKEICALRASQVRNVEVYKTSGQVFWLNDLPRHKLCRSAIWCVADPPLITSEQQAIPWIEIRKPALKSPPELPDELEPWMKEEEITDSSLNEPGINEQIPLSLLQDDSDDTDPDALASINEYPHILDKWVDYVEDKWRPWAVEDRELQKVQKAYNQLFSIYQLQEKLGEQYEVVIGIGLLLWKSPNSGEIKRHILVIQARVEFDRIRGIMTVGPALDGPQPMLECSMLETSDRPNPTDLTDIQNDVLVLDGDPWETAHLERVLRGFANSLPITGDYVPSFEYVGGTSRKPIVKLAPALILRRRTRRTFEDYYGQIIDQIKAGEYIPENVRRIIEIVEETTDEKKDGVKAEVGTAKPTSFDTEIYFPFPANAEQKRIVQKIEHRRGIRVQGPPGTGKSHTIANLIAHFLAKGKRVLVTSETPRALEVLRRMLPHEIEELCVVWLGSGPDSLKALKNSVTAITHMKANWDASKEANLVEQHAKQLDAARREQSQLRHDLRACREMDIYRHSKVFDCYSGTLQEIAVQVNEKRTRFQWFADRPDDSAKATVNSDDLLKMVHIHRTLTPDVMEQLQYRLFPLEGLIQPADFCRLVDDERKADIAQKEAYDKRSYPGYDQLSLLDRAKRDTVKHIVEWILATQENLANHFHPWAERASQEISADQDRGWRQIFTLTVDHVNHIERFLSEHGDMVVKGLQDRDPQLVRTHANALKKHVEMGKGFGFWFFRDQVVKDASYLLKSVTVNGKPCNNLQTLNQLTAWLELRTRIRSLHQLWKRISTPPTGNIILQCSAYRDLCEPLEQALTLHERIEAVRSECHDCPGIRLPAWHSREEVKAFSDALEAQNLEEDFVHAQEVFTPLVESLADFSKSGNSHGSTEQLRQAVTERDHKLYQDAYESLSVLHSLRNDHDLACGIQNRFHTCAPLTCHSYDESRSDPRWDERFAEFEAAWTWAKTDRWLDEVSDKGRPRQIQRAIENSTSRERDALKNLAASKAWHHCMANLREKERVALIAWSQAVAKIRRGTGKYAETYRETARQKLDECRKAIPAWVMPLYQVVQTTRPGKHQFDIAIIDEASQSGPESLLLNYIADKIIVVGDDKQIKPMHVGVNREQVQYLQRKYLDGIPHAEMLDLESSLFSQAELRFPDAIRLREHFRCMPEIIQFSNNLSYTDEPLIPLRQYGADRLEPVRTVFVKDGYRKGTSNTIENPPEAEAIVAQIAECCEDPAYDGKTFGVISLMGTRQSELINRLLLGMDGIGAEEMEKRRLVCGRPYDFQGDERDVIFLSMVEAPQDGRPCRMIRDPDTQRRFNVAASRARDQLWLFHSATLNNLRTDCLRYKLLHYCLNPKVDQPEEIGETTVAALRQMANNGSLRSRRPRDADASLPFDSWFEVDVFIKIVDRGYRVLPQYEIAGYRIDLVVEGLKGRLAVECDGDEWHGSDRYEKDMVRQRDLERCKWTFVRIRGSDFYRNPDVALEELWETLERLSITPRHVWESDRQRSEAEPIVVEEVRIPISDTAEKHQENTEYDAEEYYGQEREEEESVAPEGTEARLDRVLEHVRSRRRRPEEMSPLSIQNAILQSLQKCPNHSCTLKSLTSRVLKELGVSTRGNPRLEFEKRVMRNLGVLKRKGLAEEYKAKNKRVRILQYLLSPEK